MMNGRFKMTTLPKTQAEIQTLTEDKALKEALLRLKAARDELERDQEWKKIIQDKKKATDFLEKAWNVYYNSAKFRTMLKSKSLLQPHESAYRDAINSLRKTVSDITNILQTVKIAPQIDKTVLQDRLESQFNQLKEHAGKINYNLDNTAWRFVKGAVYSFLSVAGLVISFLKPDPFLAALSSINLFTGLNKIVGSETQRQGLKVNKEIKAFGNASINMFKPEPASQSIKISVSRKEKEVPVETNKLRPVMA